MTVTAVVRFNSRASDLCSILARPGSRHPCASTKTMFLDILLFAIIPMMTVACSYFVWDAFVQLMIHAIIITIVIITTTAIIITTTTSNSSSSSSSSTSSSSVPLQ